MDSLWLLRNLAGRRPLFRWSIRAAAIVLLLILVVATCVVMREMGRALDRRKGVKRFNPETQTAPGSTGRPVSFPH